MKIKLVAEKVNDIMACDDFDVEGIEVVSPETFIESLDTLSDDMVIGAEVDYGEYRELKEEYGIRENRVIKTVNDIYSEEERDVYYNYKRIMSYDNSKKRIIYNAPEVSDRFEFYTDFVEEGVVDDVETKLKTWDNPIKCVYAARVGYRASYNDPDKKLWKEFVEYAKNNQDKLFTKNGNWRKNVALKDIEKYFDITK